MAYIAVYKSDEVFNTIEFSNGPFETIAEAWADVKDDPHQFLRDYKMYSVDVKELTDEKNPYAEG